MAGSESLEKALKNTFDSQNVSFLDAARSDGYALDQDDFSSVFLKSGAYSSFVELHIEQGPLLEAEGIPIGVVTAIAAPASIKVDFKGEGGHAGAVLMPNRNDAGLAAANLALAVEKHVLASGSIDTVGTVGILDLHPRAINSIRSKAHLEIALAFWKVQHNGNSVGNGGVGVLALILVSLRPISWNQHMTSRISRDPLCLIGLKQG